MRFISLRALKHFISFHSFTFADAHARFFSSLFSPISCRLLGGDFFKAALRSKLLDKIMYLEEVGKFWLHVSLFVVVVWIRKICGRRLKRYLHQPTCLNCAQEKLFKTVDEGAEGVRSVCISVSAVFSIFM